MRRAARAVIIDNQNILLMKRNKFGNVYYCLPGGGIDMGETADQAVLREIKEEASLTASQPQLVFVEDSGDPYGMQYIFTCQFADGQIKIDPNTIEAKLNQEGKNTFQIMWVPISKFANLPFRSAVLKKELLTAFRDGFPTEPKQIHSHAEISYNKPEQGEKLA